MRTSVIISALLSASVIAHPTLQNIHLHPKRQNEQQIGKPQLDRVWKDDNGVTHEDYKVVEKIQLGPGQTQPQVQQVQPQVSQQNTDADSHQHGGDHHDHHDHQQQQPQAQQQQQQQQQQSQTQPQQKQVQQPDQKQVQQPQSQPQQQQPQPQQPQQPQTKQEQQPSSSSGNDLLDKINSIRSQWDPSLKPLAWSDKLKNNACSTGSGSEQGGKVQVHTLNPGSMGQCIAPGDANDITSAMHMWLCEIPKALQCGNSKRSDAIFARNNDPQGHAKIFQDQSYSQIGACHTGELWTADFS